jgi:hypothetical protein
VTAYRSLPAIHEAPEGTAGLGHLARAHLAAVVTEAALARLGIGPGAPANDEAACLRDWLLRLRDGDIAGWGDATAAGGWPRGPAATRTDVLQAELRRLGLIVEDLGRAVAFAPADGAGTTAAEAIAAVSLEGEPSTETPRESLSDDEYTVLRALRDRRPRLVLLDDLAVDGIRGRKVCGEIITSLMDRGLAHRPKGLRKGCTITSRGEALLTAETSHRDASSAHPAH